VVDWKSTGLDPEKALLTAPGIRDFQEYKTYRPGDYIIIEPQKGLLLWLK
jgi:hypothetical protein